MDNNPKAMTSDEGVSIKQFGRTWFNAYDKQGHYLAMGKTRREAAEMALHRISQNDARRRAGGLSGMPDCALEHMHGRDEDGSIYADRRAHTPVQGGK